MRDAICTKEQKKQPIHQKSPHWLNTSISLLFSNLTFRPPFSLSRLFLPIGLLQRSGKFHWIRVQKRYIPKEWKKASSSKVGKLRYDFAVLKLRRAHNRQHMSVQTSTLLPGSKIQFSGFHGDKWYNTLWYTYCHVYKTTADMILNFCDGVKGVSGSGVYVDTPRGDDSAVVGVVSALAEGTMKGKAIKFNIVNSFTHSKVQQISKWMARR